MSTGPVFVKIDEYQDLLDLLNITEGKLQKARALLQKVKELKSQEDLVLQTWQSEIEMVESRVQEVNTILSQSR